MNERCSRRKSRGILPIELDQCACANQDNHISVFDCLERRAIKANVMRVTSRKDRRFERGPIHEQDWCLKVFGQRDKLVASTSLSYLVACDDEWMSSPREQLYGGGNLIGIWTCPRRDLVACSLRDGNRRLRF